MSNRPQQTSTARRSPDCVTEVRKGNTILTVNGYFKQDASETADDKMVKVLQTSHFCEVEKELENLLTN